ncbi:fumarylacetoacetate hydrolase family protein [Rhodobacteraceae bacterium LMO-12]|nr:fumarylacetoacetate hydrolase family protein [Rhodobacteraceae bacterium LMO-JJ12]
MKLCRFGSVGKEKPGLILPGGHRIDVSEFGADYDEAFFESGGLERLAAWAEKNADSAPLVGDDVRVGPAICRPSKIVCIGLNFSDHAIEAGMDIPEEPVVFLKSTTAFCGVNDNVLIPPGSKKTDWEIELAVVIGKKATHIDEDVAMDHVAGYAMLNDYSERNYQIERGGQWTKGKSYDSFAPFGPFMATPDEIEDINNLAMHLSVNDETKQTGSTANYIFRIPTVISYLSQMMTLLPGDIISTGTPPGVGLGMNPPQFLNPGDTIEWTIDRLGTARQVAVAN